MISEHELEYIRAGRHKARTDLFWLCQYILGFDKVTPHVHGPMIAHLQQFDIQGQDVLQPDNTFLYTPPAVDPVKILAGSRRRLLLAPRGWYKTSVNVVAHSIQWVLNYPDITMHLIHASQELIEFMMILIKEKFHHNPAMRYFFPEFCPPERKKEWGSRQYFDTPARRHFTQAPTISVGGIESTRAGMHYHVLKFTDIVDEKNTTTKELCQKVIYNYGMYRNLLVSPNYWIDIEGTRYNYSDLYGRIIDEWLKQEKKEFQCFVMGCYEMDNGGDPCRFSPEELDLPYLLDSKGQKISRFPEEFPADKLEQMRTDPVTGEYLFACQQLNNPTAAEDDEVPFPLKYLRWKTPDALKHVQMEQYVITVDLAEEPSKRSDNTCITVCGWDRFGRCYVVDVHLGKFLPETTIGHIFSMYLKWKPVRVDIEETGFTRGLKPSIQRRSEMTGVWIPFSFIKRDPRMSKQERILSLQPWYKNGLITFSEDLPDYVKDHLKHELTRFPRYRYDDLLDTLADQFQNKPNFGPARPSRSEKEIMDAARKIMIFRRDLWEQMMGEEVRDPASDGLGGLS